MTVEMSRWIRLGLCLALTLCAAVPATAAAAPPANDDFAAAQAISLPSQVPGSTVDATIETGEPDPDELGITHSIWFEWTAAADGPVKLDTCGNHLPSVLSVWTGATVASLTEVTGLAGFCDGGQKLTFAATAGTTYSVRFAGFDDVTGSMFLRFAAAIPPVNDDFADAPQLAFPTSLTGTNLDATTEEDEPDPIEDDGSGHSVWYRVTVPTAQPVRIDTCNSEFDTVLAVYAGDSLGALTEIGSNDDGCGVGSLVDFQSAAGTTYRIAVRGYGSSEGNFRLTIGPPPPPPPPPPPAPPPTCPPAGSPAGAVAYRGTHQAGGAVCLTLHADFKSVASFQMQNVPGDICTFGLAIDRFAPTPVAIVNRTFSTAKDAISGSFGADRTVQGVFQLSRVDDELVPCTSMLLRWSATTDATPPWAVPPAPPDATAPLLRLSGATVQYPLRRNRIVVTARCPREACKARATLLVAGVRLSSAEASLRAGVARTLTLRVPAASRRRIRSALRPRRPIKRAVTVVARDAAGNRTTTKRTLTLRR